MSRRSIWRCAGHRIPNGGATPDQAMEAGATTDARAAQRLQRNLEGSRIEKDLRGRTTPMGEVLRPVCLDRLEFEADETLGAYEAFMETNPDQAEIAEGAVRSR